MKPRLRRIRREFLCIGLAFILVLLIPHTGLKSISTPVVQAQGGEATFSFTELQFDGSRYFYGASVFAGYISVDWRMYLADNIDYIVNEVSLVNVNLDSSAFYVEPGSCIGFGNCAITCNTCVTGLRKNCKLVAIGLAIAAGGAFLLSFACAIGAAATIVGVGAAFLCGVAAGAVLSGAALQIYGTYQTCKVDAVGICTGANPPCTCTG